MPEGLLRIGELSRRAGLSADVIRAWERRYDLLRPTRTPGNFRVYSADDLSRLRLMQHYLSKGVPTAQAAGLVHRVQTAALDANPGVPPGDVRRAMRVLEDALERFDGAPAERMLGRLRGVFTAGAILRDVVLPYLRELGRRWERGEASIAQEHFASSFLESWMLGAAGGFSDPGGRRAVIACLPGERHTLGLLAFGVALRDHGWNITYLGADTPVEATEEAARAVTADVVVVSCALPATFAGCADAVRELAHDLPLAVGGAGIVGNGASWLASRTLPADPLVAAEALSATLPARSPVAAPV